MSKVEKMTDDDLVKLIDEHIVNAAGAPGSELSKDREELLDRYNGKFYGNEVEGRSQVRTREVYEAVEQIMPVIMQIFASGDKVAQFPPMTRDDDDQAAVETDYINHVFYNDNNGYEILSTLFKDALIQRTGTVKVYWEENTDKESESYEGLDDMQLLGLMSQDVEPTHYTQNEDGSHSIRIEVEAEVPGRIVIENTPVDEFIVGENLRSVDYSDPSCDFVCFRPSKTVSQLIEEGFDRKVVEDAYDSGQSIKDAKYHENSVNDTGANRHVTVDDAFLLVDQDGDGIAELRHVVKVGNTVLLNEEVEEVPFETVTPIPVPHEWAGLAVSDSVIDLQEQATTFKRQMLDNLYQLNDGRLATNDNVNSEDLLNPVTQGIVRIEGAGSVHESIMPIPVPPVLDSIMPILNMIKEEGYARTGQSSAAQGANMQVLAQSTKGAFEQALERADARTELIARNFAEGVRRIMLHIHRLLRENQDFDREIKTSAGWQSVNPSDWRERDRMDVAVGLGTGNKDAQLARLWQLASKQEEHLMNGSPLVTPENLHHTYEKVIEISGLRNVDAYFTNPAKAQPSEPEGPDAQTQFATAQLESLERVEKGKQELQASKQEADVMLKLKELELKEFEVTNKLEIEAAKVPGQQSIEEQLLDKESDAEQRALDREADLLTEHIKQSGETERTIIGSQHGQ